MLELVGLPYTDDLGICFNHVTGWQDLTSNFYSRPDDIHACANYAGDRLALPLCTASCNSEYLIESPFRAL